MMRWKSHCLLQGPPPRNVTRASSTQSLLTIQGLDTISREGKQHTRKSLEERMFKYYVREAEKNTYLIADRCNFSTKNPPAQIVHRHNVGDVKTSLFENIFIVFLVICSC